MNTLFDCIQLLLAVVIYCSWLYLVVFMHFVREYGKSGFKVEMYSIYCSLKEVFSFFYILSHWVCFGIMTCLLIIDYEIDGRILLNLLMMTKILSFMLLGLAKSPIKPS